jgi:hypothetical protein
MQTLSIKFMSKMTKKKCGKVGKVRERINVIIILIKALKNIRYESNYVL